jgi:hypothetical protein
MVCAMDVTATLSKFEKTAFRAWQPAVIARDAWLFLVVYDRLGDILPRARTPIVQLLFVLFLMPSRSLLLPLIPLVTLCTH